jgi:perosamine synthetase
MFYLMPPSGTPISIKEIAEIVALRVGLEELDEPFSQKLTRLTGSKHVWLLNSGRAALLVLLRELSRIAGPEKKEVVIPSWTCFSVAASIVRAGLKIRLVDIAPISMDYDYSKLREIDYNHVLAVIASNLFGIVSDWSRLRAITKEQSVFLIDDAAQAFGTMVNGRAAGTLGDAGFYSLDRGKNLSTCAGGVLVTDNDDLAKYIEVAIESLPTPGIISETATVLKFFLHSMFLRPRCYWFPNMLPFLGLGETVYDEHFSVAKLSRLQQYAGALLIDRLNLLNTQRSARALEIAEGIRPLGKFEIPSSQEVTGTIYLRLPVLAADQTVRDRAVRFLRKGGITASTMYPAIISEIRGIEQQLASLKGDYPGGKQVLARLFTLPTHAYVGQEDIDKILAILKEV